MTASSVLGQIKDIDAIPHLRKVVAKEQNLSCREQMEIDLEHLEKAQH